MAGIYIHIPFCKKKCIYCNFHISTNIILKKEMVSSLINEIILQKKFLYQKKIKTIYFGGGTPSILEKIEIYNILNTIYNNFIISKNVEITIECNPDDINYDKFKFLYNIGINRISVGIQSFNDNDLKFMKRIHTSKDAYKSIIILKNLGFSNISIDLIYGIPTMNDKNWIQNINNAINLNINHISAYSLTLEDKTELDFLIKNNILPSLDEEKDLRQYYLLINNIIKYNFIQYEISNFSIPGFFSKHNINYWKCNIPYLGIGPSSHSFNNNIRQWNISNNIKYINYIKKNIIPATTEYLTISNIYNEYVMTGLRTIWGINLKNIIIKCGYIYYKYLIKKSKKFILKNIIILNNNHLILNKKYWIYINQILIKLFI